MEDEQNFEWHLVLPQEWLQLEVKILMLSILGHHSYNPSHHSYLLIKIRQQLHTNIPVCVGCLGGKSNHIYIIYYIFPYSN